MSKETGGPAFPYDFGAAEERKGMTLWDYFAAHTPNYLSSMSIKDATDRLGIPIAEYNVTKHFPKLVSLVCADYADAMISERKKRFEDSNV